MSSIIRNVRTAGTIAIVLSLALVFTWACAKTPVIPAAAKAPEAKPAPAAAAAEGSVIGGYEFANVYFDYNSSRITAKAGAVLKKHAEWLKKNKDYVVKIEGYCDQRGTDKYNMALGKKRAESAKKALVKMGVSAKRISTVSYGEGKPVCTEDNEGCWAKNRRGVFVVTKK